MKAENNDKVSQDDIEKAIAVLKNLLADTDQLFEIDEDQRVDLMTTAGQLSRPSREEFQKRRKDAKKAAKRKMIERDKHARKETGIRSAREDTVFVAPKFLEMPKAEDTDTPELESPRNCYVCKTVFTKLHHFYDTMCSECADFNYAKRFQTADLNGQVAVVTGSRLKIGYHITLILLRSGATVVATTRFPVDSALRFSKEDDFTDWGHRLHIHGLDLRHIPSVEIFCNFIEMKYKRLDILINNAAQTVRRPAGFFKHLMDKEETPISELPEYAKDLLKDHHDCIQELNTLADNIADEKNLPVTWHGKQPGIGLSSSAKLSQIPYSFDNSLRAEEVFPEGELDVDLQQVDLRTSNSWRLKLGEIETLEMMEVQLVNSIAPFQTADEISSVVNYFLKHDLDSLITVVKSQVHCDFINHPVNYKIDEVFAQTQDLEPVYPFAYSLMMWKRESFLENFQKNGHALMGGVFSTYPVSKLSGMIIKYEEDLLLADAIMRYMISNSRDSVKYDNLVSNINTEID